MKHLLLSSLLILSVTAFGADNSELCRANSPRQISFSKSPQTRDFNEITLITWNAHKLADPRFFYDLKALSERSDILMVQEAMHSTAWQAAFASHFQMSFSFFKSFCDGDNQATGVMTASRGLLEHNRTIVSPWTEPITFTPKVSGYSQVVLNNQIIHLINTHALNFNTGSDFEAQIDNLIQFIAGLQGPVIWAGDFNTWSPGRKNYLYEKTRAIGLTHVIPAEDHRRLILDHIYVRGFGVRDIEVLKNESSDHYPMRAVLTLNSNRNLMTNNGIGDRH